jgi:hypothetical protein
MSCKPQDDKRVSFGEVAKHLNDGVSEVDVARTAGLTQLARVRAVKGIALEREHTRLQAKLGAEHPRVADIKAKIAANQDLRRDVDLGLSRAATPTVRPEADAWILHGHVRDTDAKGVAGLTVSLDDEKQQPLRDLGSACTDKNGYFQICYRRPKKVDAVEAASTQAPKVFIRVSDKQGALLQRDTNALTPAFGRIDYREIILNGDDACGSSEGTPTPSPRTGRYIGNSSKLEIHDSKNVTKRCQVEAIKPEHRVTFKSEKEAAAAGYDRCAFCFGKEKSKH